MSNFKRFLGTPTHKKKGRFSAPWCNSVTLRSHFDKLTTQSTKEILCGPWLLDEHCLWHVFLLQSQRTSYFVSNFSSPSLYLLFSNRRKETTSFRGAIINLGVRVEPMIFFLNSYIISLWDSNLYQNCASNLTTLPNQLIKGQIQQGHIDTSLIKNLVLVQVSKTVQDIKQKEQIIWYHGAVIR